MSYGTEQERFWAGEFGDGYAERNPLESLLPARISLFARILARTSGISSVMEFGANVGANLVAIHLLLPNATVKSLEINEHAIERLRSLPWMDDVIHGSLTVAQHVDEVDLAFTSGVLIHVPPSHLTQAYENLYAASGKYIVLCEYYSPVPVEVPYRGHRERLFKRDFAGEMLDRYDDLELVDYGFAYHRDPVHPMDDSNWFLMRKRPA
jgi:spore coat polysaccharide biosynthesis protein SpsF